MSKTVPGPDGKPRCGWGAATDDFFPYHDNEWGYPVDDDIRLFEKICLEGFQSGLSWLTILRKREAFRAAFANFEFETVAGFTEADVLRCLDDSGIVRHRRKIESTINNARRALELREEFGSLAAYFWSHEPAAENRPKKLDFATARTLGKTAESTALSKDLKKRGWSFVGPTMGMVNDHLEGCCCREKVEKARADFRRPV